MPALMGGFANYLLPVQQGSPDMAKLKPILKEIEKIKWGVYDKNQLGYYLAGLIEGDGYLSLNNKNNLMICITFHIWDTPLALKLIDYFGQGYIAKRPGNSIELRVSNRRGLEKLITLLNGKFRTPKIDQLYKAIEHMNKKYNTNLIKLPLDSSPIQSNAWWSGFIDADGGFYIRYNKNSRLCSFRLEQRMIYPVTQVSYFQILNKVCIFLKVSLHTRTRVQVKRTYFQIRVENQASLKILITYLDKYPLLTHKYLNYQDWKSAFSIILNKTHFTEKGSLDILNYKNQMNSKRSVFTWHHI